MRKVQRSGEGTCANQFTGTGDLVILPFLVVVVIRWVIVSTSFVGSAKSRPLGPVLPVLQIDGHIESIRWIDHTDDLASQLCGAVLIDHKSAIRHPLESWVTDIWQARDPECPGLAIAFQFVRDHTFCLFASLLGCLGHTTGGNDDWPDKIGNAILRINDIDLRIDARRQVCQDIPIIVKWTSLLLNTIKCVEDGDRLGRPTGFANVHVEHAGAGIAI